MSPLPDRPDLEQLRRRAKELRDQRQVNLATAQLAVAREHGYPSWPRLKAAVEERRMDARERLHAFLDASVRHHFMPDTHVRAGRAARLLDDDPGLATGDIRAAAVLGEVAEVRRRVDRDPTAATRRDPESGLPPLLFACSSRWHWIDPARASGIVEVARLLLDAGASPDSVMSPPHSCSALYLAAGMANHHELARLLLDRGADPDAGGTLYHTAFHRDHVCLRMLLDAGASEELQDTLAAAISVRDADAVRILLDGGADAGRGLPAPAMGERYAQEPPVGAAYAAVEFDCSAELLALLLDRGADPDGEGQNGWPAMRLAVRRGRTDLVDLLRGHGATEEADAVDHVLGACATGDRATADRLLTRAPTALDGVDQVELGDALCYAAELGRVEAVRSMLDLGVGVDVRDTDGATALHKAAGAGDLAVVQLLVDRGADLAAGDGTFGGKPAVVGHRGQRAGHGPQPARRPGGHGTGAARRRRRPHPRVGPRQATEPGRRRRARRPRHRPARRRRTR